MPVPDTTTFTLQDVINEILSLSFDETLSDPSLSGCFAAAINDGFNPSHVGAKDRLSNFRGYNHAALLEYNFY